MTYWVAGAALVGSVVQSSSASGAANKQKSASDAATAMQQGIYNDTVTRNAPYVQGGSNGLAALLGRLGIGGTNGQGDGYGTLGHVPTAEEVMAQPGYQFGLQEGQRGVNNALNARGMSYSGAALKAASRFNNDYATGKYQQAFSNKLSGDQQVYNQLMGVAGLGQQAANNTSSYGAQFGTQAGANMMGGANAQAANSLAQGNIWGSAFNQAGSAFKNGSGGGGGGEYTSPNMFGNYSNPSGSTYDYRGGYLDNSLRGGG